MGQHGRGEKRPTEGRAVAGEGEVRVDSDARLRVDSCRSGEVRNTVESPLAAGQTDGRRGGKRERDNIAQSTSKGGHERFSQAEQDRRTSG